MTEDNNELSLTEDNNELSIIDEVTNLSKTENIPSMSFPEVLEKAELADVHSFGDKTFGENSALVEQAFKNTNDLAALFNRGHNQWIWKHINMSNFSDYYNVRQVHNEISHKKSILNDLKWKFLKQKVSLQKMYEDLEDESLSKWQKFDLNIKIAQHHEIVEENRLMVEGAMKDVLALNEIYEELKVKVNGFDEHDFEQQEPIGHLKRSLTQSLRDIRMGGRITKGEQEYLEQCGANVSKIQKLLIEFCDQEQESESWDNVLQLEFIDKLAHELVEVHKVSEKRANWHGFSDTPIEDLSIRNKIALLTSEEKDL